MYKQQQHSENVSGNSAVISRLSISELYCATAYSAYVEHLWKSETIKLSD